MFNPCYDHCYLRYGKQYSECCKDTCEYAQIANKYYELTKASAKKSYSDFDILIDMDDVMIELCDAWCKWLNDKYGTNVSYEQIIEWNISKFFPKLSKSAIFEPLQNSDFWDNVKPKKDAVKYIEKLANDGFNIFICTATDYRNVELKFKKIIQRFFPFIEWEQVIIIKTKQKINADYLIDDGIHNLEGGKYKGIVMTAPHNKKYNTSQHNMYRVDDWESAYELIKICANKRIKEDEQYEN